MIRADFPTARLVCGLVAVAAVSFGLLAVVEYAAWSLILSDRLLLGGVIGIAGPILALRLAAAASRPIAWLTSRGTA